MQVASNNPDEYKKTQIDKKKEKDELLRLDSNEVRRRTVADNEKRKKERALKMMQNMEEAKADNPEVKMEQILEEQEKNAIVVQQEIKKELTQQSESLQKRLAERRKRLQNKRSINSSVVHDEEIKGDESQLGAPSRFTNVNQFRPMTMRGSPQKKFLPILEEEFNEISMIKDFTQLENTQFIDDQSFTQDLQLIRHIENNTAASTNTGGANSKQQRPMFSKDSYYSQQILVDTTFDDDMNKNDQEDYNFYTDATIETEYKESMMECFKVSDTALDQLQKEKEEKILQITEELISQKFEKAAEIKASYDFMIKRLESSKQKEKAEVKKKEKEQEIKQMYEEIDTLKKQRIEEINKEYEEKKGSLKAQNENRINEVSSKLSMIQKRAASNMSPTSYNRNRASPIMKEFMLLKSATRQSSEQPLTASNHHHHQPERVHSEQISNELSPMKVSEFQPQGEIEVNVDDVNLKPTVHSPPKHGKKISNIGIAHRPKQILSIVIDDENNLEQSE